MGRGSCGHLCSARAVVLGARLGVVDPVLDGIPTAAHLAATHQAVVGVGVVVEVVLVLPLAAIAARLHGAHQCSAPPSGFIVFSSLNATNGGEPVARFFIKSLPLDTFIGRNTLA